MNHQRPPSAQSRFITPTQGLSSRQGQTLQSNLENVGGRFLIQTQMAKHKERMRCIRSVVSIEPPWGHESAVAGTSSTQQHRPAAGPNRPVSSAARKLGSDVGRPTSAHIRAAAANHSTNSSSAAAASTAKFDLTTLTPEQQATYRDMTKFVAELNNDEARSVLEQLFADAEERRLLDQYSGVLPKMGQEGSAEGRAVPESP